MVYYRTNGVGSRSAPTALCHLVQDTHNQTGARHHHETPAKPQDRYRRIKQIVEQLLKQVPVGNAALSVSNRPGRVQTKPFLPPSLRFGNDVILSADLNKQDLRAAIRDYGKARLSLLKDKRAGFIEQSRLDRQYLVLPKSAAAGFGSQFLEDLRRQVEALYPQGGKYDPEIIVYDDRNRRDFVSQSRAIREAVENHRVKAGFALVMVHRYDRRPRSADQLAAWTVKEFPTLFDLGAAVIHTDMANKAYAAQKHGSETHYYIKNPERGRFSGYLRNVALNKILLTNGKWPFTLATPLHADVVIGIDVKNNTAAFTLFAEGGRIIRSFVKSSRQREQLLAGQVRKYVYEIIREEAPYFNQPPQQIVIHRDGLTWPAEIAGLKEACDQLASDGLLVEEWRLTVVEIRKSSLRPLRMFDVQQPKNNQKTIVKNPLVGTWVQFTPDEGNVCTTGQPFSIPGTANPLHIRRSEGVMPIEHCLSDVYLLSCLTWTRPEGATRLPLSLKLCDRSLFDEAAEYDRDAIEFEESRFQKERET